MKVVAIHVGAHKTATTHVQSRLSNSRQTLKRNGISYVPLPDLKRILTSRLDKPVYSPREVLAGLDSYLDCERLILSDENILGHSRRPAQNRIYPRAQARVAKVLETFAAYQIEIYVTLRNYPAYFTSRYAEALRHFPFCTFDEFYGDIDFNTVSWRDLLETLFAAGAKSLTVSDFGTLLENERAYHHLLLGRSDLDLEEPDSRPEVRRAKFSAEGYEVIRTFARHHAADKVKEVVRLLDKLPQKTAATEFMPLGEAQRGMLQARYAAEMQALRAGADARISVRCG